MDLYNGITKRKASRDFTSEALDNKELDEMIKMLEGFELLHQGSSLKFRIVTKTKGMFNITAPHYLIISGKGKSKRLLNANAGFVGQRFVLWLHTKDIGSVWLGKSKEKGEGYSKNDIVVIAFGKTKGSIKRKLSEFKRKDIEEITNTPEDEQIKMVHLAPSGINLQPWYFCNKDDKIIVYEQKMKFPLSFFYQITAIDMGIALCHYKIVCEYYNKPFLFRFIKGKSDKKGYRLFGKITL